MQRSEMFKLTFFHFLKTLMNQFVKEMDNVNGLTRVLLGDGFKDFRFETRLFKYIKWKTFKLFLCPLSATSNFSANIW